LQRREFLRGAAAGALLLGVPGLPLVCDAETQLEPVPADPALQQLRRLIEDTPRERLLEEIGARIQRGLSYREVLSALLLAGVGSVKPQPVGFRFHAVLAIHAAHQAAQAAPASERWLPIFWSLDSFKSAQAEERARGGWQLAPVQESEVPPATHARAAFEKAMNDWDAEAADGAAAAVARHLDARDAFELFAALGPRDFRDIGHKVIYVAGAFRLLEIIGWSHAEPVLRSLAFALNDHGGQNPARSDQEADRAGRRNRERLGTIRSGWRDGKPDGHAAGELLRMLRTASDAEASQQVVELLNAGVSPASVWDGLFSASGELLMRRTGIVSLHALTTLNALAHCFQASADDTTRRFALLQAAAFVPSFRGGPVDGVQLDELEPAEGSPDVDAVFADVARDNLSASRRLLAYCRAGGDPAAIVNAARALIVRKGSDAHDYKFTSAVLEDAARLSPRWRERYLAASLHYLPGPSSPDSDLLPRIRTALAR
jgi:hypothetical protein